METANNNIETQSLTGQANTSLRRTYISRKRQRIATIILAFVLILVIVAVLVWVIIFEPNQYGCSALKDEICANKMQETYYNETLFKVVYQNPESQSYVFRSTTPFDNNYKIADFSPILKPFINSSELNQYTIHFYTLITGQLNDIEHCNLNGIFCYKSSTNNASRNYDMDILVYPIVGDITSPYDETNTKKDFKLSSQKDDLISKIQEIDSIIEKEYNIVIINSRGGINRVGEVSGAYKLSKDFDFVSVMKENIFELGQNVKPFINSIMWYCESLNKSETLGCQNVYTMNEFTNVTFFDNY